MLAALLGLAACGATPKIDDVSRLERSDMVPATTEVLRAPTLKDIQRDARNATFQELLTFEAETLLETTDLTVELDVQSFMIPDEMQAKITGARAYVSTHVTIKTVSGAVIVDSAEVNFVAPKDGPSVTNPDALVLAFGKHLQSSLRIR